MKTVFTLILATSVSLSAWSQAILGAAISVTSTPTNVALRAAGGNPSDTLGLQDFLLGTPTAYAVPGSGLATGSFLSVDTFLVNGIGAVSAETKYIEFGEGYLIGDDYLVTGAMFYLGALQNISGSVPDVTVNLRLVEDNKAISNPTTVQTPDIPGPGQILSSVTVPFSNLVDTVGGGEVVANFVTFDPPSAIDNDVVISLNIASVYDSQPMDLIAVMANADGEGDGEYTFHRLTQNVSNMSGAPVGSADIWTNTSSVLANQSGQGLDINLALFPIVTPPTDVTEIGYFNGLRASIFPNPGLSNGDLTLTYGLKNSSNNVIINIINASGKLMTSFSEGAKPSGEHTVKINSDLFSSGTYFYSIKADGRKMAQAFVVR